MQDFIQDISDRVALAKMNNRRVAFWGGNQHIFTALFREGALNGLEFMLVARSKQETKLRVLNKMPEKPERMKEFMPDEILILETSERIAIALYEVAIRRYGYSPLQVFLPKKFWHITCHVSDSAYYNCLDGIPKNIQGGLSPGVPLGLFDAMKHVVRENVPGNIVNMGVFQGYSMYYLALILRYYGDNDRRLIGLDTFSGFLPTGSTKDVFCEHSASIDGGGWSHFKSTSIEKVRHNLCEFENIELVEGDIRQTIKELGDESVALVFFDMDDYSPTRCALGPLFERLSPGGCFVLDHFEYNTLSGGHCIGQRIAMLEFLEEHSMFHLSGTNVFLKNRRLG